MRARVGLLMPAKITVPSAMARTGSPIIPAMSSPAWRRAPPDRSSPGPLGATRGTAFQRRHDRDPDVRRQAGRILEVVVTRDHAPALGEDQILVAARTHHIAPGEMRDAAPVRPAAERGIDLLVPRLPHLQQRGAHGQVHLGIEQTLRRQIALVHRQLRRARHAVHARLDGEQPVRSTFFALVGGIAAAAETRQRGERERVALRRRRRGDDLRAQRGRRRIGRDAAQVRPRRRELRRVDRRRRRVRFGGPCRRVSELMRRLRIDRGLARLPGSGLRRSAGHDQREKQDPQRGPDG